MASFNCPPGAICSDQAATNVGSRTKTVSTRTRVDGRVVTKSYQVPDPNTGTKIYHRTVTNVTQDKNGTVNGGTTDIYIIKDGQWQKAGTSTDGGRTYTFDDNVAGADLQRDLNNAQSAIHKNTDAQVSKKLDEAGIKPTDKGNIISSLKNKGNTGGDGNPTGDSSRPADQTSQSTAASERTRNDGFGDYTYPLSLGRTKQDVIKFTMLKYQAPGLNQVGAAGGLFKVGGQRDSGRKGIGSVTLPIPGGISDTNAANWNGESMNAAEAFAAKAAMDSITQGLAAGANTIATAAQEVSSNEGASSEAGTGLAGVFAAAASGTGGSQILGRTQGLVLNPNLELLFQGPTLRPFNFTFKLSAREPAEAKEILKIIRFFKQGMAPIRSQANLFLKSPHTFRIQYLDRSKQDHFALNKFKECALQSFSVQYTPEGNYATFEDGVMTSYEITMQFQELEPVYNDDYGSGTFPAEIGF